MSRIDAAGRTLSLKLVYYGPALGGKTTNLRALHQLADPAGKMPMRSLETEGDRTLFFDLLPMQLPDVCGFSVNLRLFTVPGQVHYNATRRIVLQGADAVVFVADSAPDRMEANRESLASLHANLVANGLAAGDVPIVVQANKRDLADAVPLERFLGRLGVESLGDHLRSVLPDVLPAEALAGVGVAACFETALRAAAVRVHRRHGLHRLGVPRDKFAFALREALAPIRSRAQRVAQPVAAPPPSPRPIPEAHARGALGPEALLVESVGRALDLAEALGDQSALATSLERRVRELETINELSRILVSVTSQAEVARALAVAAAASLAGGAGSFLAQGADGRLAELAVSGVSRDPLLSVGDPPLAWIVHRGSRPVAWPDLENDLALGDASVASRLVPHCTGAAVPVRMPDGRAGLLIAYGSDPNARAEAGTTRFLAAVAAQGALAFQNTDRHAQLVSHGESLEAEVAARTGELRLAHQELMAASQLKDRVLSCVNHELRTPVTKLLAAAQVLERAKPGATPPPALLATLVSQARHLAALLDQTLSARTLLSATHDGADTGAAPVDLGRTIEAVVLACQERATSRKVAIEIEPGPREMLVACEPSRLSLVLAQLVDNAVKFTKPGTAVRVATRLVADGRVRVVVSDHGPGVPPTDVERIFVEFDQGSADHLVAKPDGLGLGLAIARRLARRLGGDVGVEPPVAGSGAAFWVEVLVAKVEQPVGAGA